MSARRRESKIVRILNPKACCCSLSVYQRILKSRSVVARILGQTCPYEARSASISLAYNIGTRAFCKSSARKAFDAGDWETACDKFLLWDKVRIDGVLKKSRGLANRRAEERELCLEGLVASV